MTKQIYNTSLLSYERIKTSVVQVGQVGVGGSNAIRLQSMTNTDTNNVAATVAQCKAIIDAGGEYVRITAQGVREAEQLEHIRKQLHLDGYTIPLVADIHFNPKAAEVAARLIEKVRINPGNYVDRKRGETLSYTDEEYAAELEKIRTNLRPLLEICKQHGTAIRIGVNHGSLSDRIMSRYGDTALGMVISLLEFIRICKEEGFLQLVLSIKASNTRIMVQACRLLSAMLQEENLSLPLHLGVTEAGDSEDGRIKSAVGIGALLLDGIGDTIRVSLTEAPEAEIPVARKIVDHCTSQQGIAKQQRNQAPFNPFEYNRRTTREVIGIGGNRQPVVLFDARSVSYDGQAPAPDFMLVSHYNSAITQSVTQIVPLAAWNKADGTVPFIPFAAITSETQQLPSEIFVLATASEIAHHNSIQLPEQAVLILTANETESFYHLRAAVFNLMDQHCNVPVILSRNYNETDLEWLQVRSGADFGALLLDGLGDGIMLQNTSTAISQANLRATAFGVLQAARVRYSKTEYISCPSCGRTLFDIQSTVREIKQRTSHLKGLKIGVMGCIVNGPGEMADADYGYVGAGRGQITLYKGKSVQQTNIPADKAVDALVDLIKQHGDWQDMEK